MSTSSSTINRFGWLANTFAVGSLLMCYGKAAVAAVFAIMGLFLSDMVEDVQAILMWLFALIAVIGLTLDRKQHKQNKPLILCIVGVLVMVATLYGYYDWRILTFSYICIIAAVFLNQNIALKSLYQTIQNQAGELEQWNTKLEQRVNDQVTEIESLGRLKRFLSPQVAKLVTESGDESLLTSHRRYVAALFCDLRGFTAFSGQIEPEDAMEVLQIYHEEMGKIVSKFDGTIAHRAGDGLMVIFNDPIECDAPVMRAMEMAIDMRIRIGQLVIEWRKRGYKLGFGIGMAAGYATLGVVGYEGRFDYTANGNVINLASRLSDEAKDNQIIINQKAYSEIADDIEIEELADLSLKGIERPVRAYNVLNLLTAKVR